MQGVYSTVKKDGTPSYRASLTYKMKHISLGSYSTEKKAAKAYSVAQSILLKGKGSIHHIPAGLSRDKAVSLINLRDNGIYFATPIYLMKSYFLYVLDENIICKFDMDDLFFYASHKIGQRGGHLYVADYGSQLTLQSRYGIRGYSSPGKDCIFINGDPYDFRYHNISVKNPFYGVEMIGQGELRWKTKLHIRSSYVVGTYGSAAEAAVAYNKAADIAKRNGINRNFPLNYVEELSPSAYANMYDAIKISDRIYELRPDNV